MGFQNKKRLLSTMVSQHLLLARMSRARAIMRAKFDIGEEDFLLICVAKITEANGVDILVQAVSRVLRQGISCKCIIVGDGPLENEATNGIEFTGPDGSRVFRGIAKRYTSLSAGGFGLYSHFSQRGGATSISPGSRRHAVCHV